MYRKGRKIGKPDVQGEFVGSFLSTDVGIKTVHSRRQKKLNMDWIQKRNALAYCVPKLKIHKIVAFSLIILELLYQKILSKVTQFLD